MAAHESLTAAKRRDHLVPDAALTPDTTVAQAFTAILVGSIAEFRRSARQLQATRDSEALHQLHVAVRRLRTAVALFDGAIAKPHRVQWRALRGRLKSIARPVGVARDFDVFLAAHANDATIAHRFAAPRRNAYDEALQALVGAAPVMRRLAQYARDGAPLRRAVAAARAADFIAPRLTRLRNWLRRHGRNLADLPPVARHQFRLRVKRLRYAAEYCAPLYDGKRVAHRQARLALTLERLQSRLGELNDLAVGARLLGLPELTGSRHSAALTAHATRHFARFDRIPRFWR